VCVFFLIHQDKNKEQRKKIRKKVQTNRTPFTCVVIAIPSFFPL